MDIFFNELSNYQPAISIHEASRRLEVLGEIIKIFPIPISGIRTPENFASTELGPDYRLGDWIHTFESEKQDLKSLILTKVDSAPYHEQYISDLFNEKLIEFIYGDNSECIGLGLASPILFNTISISFNIEDWNLNSVNIKANIYNGDEIECKNIEVRHISNLEHLQFHENWLKLTVRPGIKSGKQLWLKRNELFPSLIFCDSIESQISKLNSGDPSLNQIIDRLDELNKFCKEWPKNTPFDPDRFLSKVTPESASRLKDFKKELTIMCPDGNYRLFSWHARFTPGAGRIHFYDNPLQRTLTIGSISNQNGIK